MTELSPAARKLERQMEAGNSLLCVGLDPDLERMPQTQQGRAGRNPVVNFCLHIARLTAPFACAFKLNTAFFEARGADGWGELEGVTGWLREHYPDHFLIADAKRADIGHTNQGYARALFDELGFDAVTLHPYLGGEALKPFLNRVNKACIVLCRTSNPGAGELQDLMAEGRPVWEHVARRVHEHWNTRGNCMLVVGATYPVEMRRIREIAPGMTFLVPGIGAQGGDIAEVLEAGLRPDGKGLLLSSSRAILYAGDPAGAARDTRDSINAVREQILARH